MSHSIQLLSHRTSVLVHLPKKHNTTLLTLIIMAFPPGGTYFDGKKSFNDVTIDQSKDNAINTTEFLEAAEALTQLFDVLGGVAFNPVKNDMGGNIKKIRERQLAAPVESETLQDLVRNELKTKKHTATEGLLWLNR